MSEVKLIDNTSKLAVQIYQRLVKCGAKIGNVSIMIIEQVINDNVTTQTQPQPSQPQELEALKQEFIEYTNSHATEPILRFFDQAYEIGLGQQSKPAPAEQVEEAIKRMQEKYISQQETGEAPGYLFIGDAVDVMEDIFSALEAAKSEQSLHIAELEKQVETLKLIAHLIGCIYFYGDFKAETKNEKYLQTLLELTGFFYISEETLIRDTEKYQTKGD